MKVSEIFGEEEYTSVFWESMKIGLLMKRIRQQKL